MKAPLDGAAVNRRDGDPGGNRQVPWRLALVLMLWSVAGGLHAAFYTMGNDPEKCDFTDLQEALEAAEHDYPERVTIHVTRNVSVPNPPLIVRGGDVTLRGGYFSCDSQVRAHTTDLSAHGQSRVLVVETGASDPTQLRLDGFQVTDGHAFSGAGIQIKRARVTLFNTNVIGNVATRRGGGIELLDGSILQILGDSRIAANFAGLQGESGQGGGVFCGGGAGAGGSIVMAGSSGVTENQAVPGSVDPARGGGVYLTDSCQLLLTGNARIASNRADEGGGGYLVDEAKLVVDPLESPPSVPRIEFNQVTASGGALYLDGGSKADVRGGHFLDNGPVTGSMHVEGGVFFLTQGASVQARPERCRPPSDVLGPSCLTLLGNQADHGALAVILPGASFDLQRAVIADNSSPGSSLIAGGGSVAVGNSFIVQNSVSSILSAAPQSLVELNHNTIADNIGIDSVLQTIVSGGQLEFSNNLVMESDVPVLQGPGSFDHAVWSCHVGPMGQAEPFDRQQIIHNADFVAPEMLDYHLGGDSQAIDSCDGPLLDPELLDIDGEVRPVDLAVIPGGFYTDAGADEARGEIELRRLTVEVEGEGRVFDQFEERIDCPDLCEVNLNSLRNIELYAEPGPGMGAIWGVNCVEGGANFCTVQMDGDQLVPVRFAPLRTVSIDVHGPGKVSGNHGIACLPAGGQGCDVEVVQGELIRVEAVADRGAKFTEWGGTCAFAGTNAVCEIRAEFPLEIQARFVIDESDTLFADDFESPR